MSLNQKCVFFPPHERAFQNVPTNRLKSNFQTIQANLAYWGKIAFSRSDFSSCIRAAVFACEHPAQYEDDHDLMTSWTVYSHITTSLLVRWVHLFPQPPQQISLYIRPFESISHPAQFGPVIAKSPAERCIIAFCPNDCEERHIFSPRHSTCPSPSKPGLHLQTYSAGRLQHSAFSTHLAASSGMVHSSMSEK